MFWRRMDLLQPVSICKYTMVNNVMAHPPSDDRLQSISRQKAMPVFCVSLKRVAVGKCDNIDAHSLLFGRRLRLHWMRQDGAAQQLVPGTRLHISRI